MLGAFFLRLYSGSHVWGVNKMLQLQTRTQCSRQIFLQHKVSGNCMKDTVVLKHTFPEFKCGWWKKTGIQPANLKVDNLYR